MKAAEYEYWREALLEHLYGCSEDSEEIERKLAEDAELRALYEEVRGTAELLEAAAKESVPELELTLPQEQQPTAPSPGLVRRFFTPLRIAATVLFTLGLGLTGSVWGFHELELRSIRSNSLRLVVSGPSGVPDGAPAGLRVETWNLDSEELPAEVAWTAFDAEGVELERGEAQSRGAIDIAFAASVDQLRRVEVTARRGDVTRQATFELSPDRANPLAHLSTDKAAYRPGETVWLRAVLLQRLSLKPFEGYCQLRVVDPKGAPAGQWSPRLEEGVAALPWTIPADAAGGMYTLELRDARNEFSAESLKFLVRRYQPPQLAKKITLDRETYAPGESGSAEVQVERVVGGIPQGGTVNGELIVDGELVWGSVGQLDAAGRVVFLFQVPEEVERGDARFAARVVADGVVETELEPFVIPVGGVEVVFYPEGGELVAGVTTRVYAEVTDPLGRPTSARGRVLDRSDREVATFETLHQGRARFEFTPRANESYRLEFTEPVASAAELPPVRAAGIGLRAFDDSTAPGQALGMEVTTQSDGPWVAGLFCRGVLVAQDVFSGVGEHSLSFLLPETVAGVLRVTVFNRNMKPVAERLVHRASGRSIGVQVKAHDEAPLPGGHQVLDFTAIDETGAPIACTLGVSVTDRAVRDMVGDVRIGLADQTWLVADVEELEDAAEFLAPDAEARRNVDLLLGTRGWRRFAWLDPAALIEERGDEAKRLLVREGSSPVPAVLDDSGDTQSLLAGARRSAREGQERFGAALAITAAGFVLWLVFQLFWWALLRLLAERPVLRWTSAGALTGTCVLVLLVALQRSMGGLMPDAEVAMGRLDFAPGGAAADGRNGEGPELQILAALDPWEADLDGEAEEWRRAAGGGGGRLEQWNFFLGKEGDVGLQAEFGFDLIAVEHAAEPAAIRDLLREEPAGREVFLLEAEKDVRWEAGLRDERAKKRRQYTRVYAHRNQAPLGAPRTDFTETVYWNGLLPTSAEGTARVEFDLSDRITTWQVNIDAHGAGRVGQALASFEAVTPFHLDAHLPVELTVGDTIVLPVAFASGKTDVATAELAVDVAGPLALPGGFTDVRVVELEAGRGRLLVPLEATAPADGARIALAGRANGWTDRVVRSLKVVPRGFPQHVAKSGLVRDSVEFEVAMPEDYDPASLEVELVLYPSPLADLLSGLDGILRQPCGCFEQASSSNYPNVLTLSYLEAAGANEPAIMARARELMGPGYDKIAGYECFDLGYEWFGGDPGHEALSAYGLLEFHDMAKVFDVDAEMVQRTRDWLLGRRDGKGGYLRNSRALDSFGAAPEEITDAYITYALVTTGQPPADLEAELARTRTRALESNDPYEVALAAASLQAAEEVEAADAARERLKTMQEDDGSLEGTTSSITRSGGRDLVVETTSLAILAWLADENDAAHVQRAVTYLLESRGNGGTFGATQATIQALRALTEYARVNRRVANPGTARLFVNDYPSVTLDIRAGQRDAISFVELAESLRPGVNRVRLELEGGNEFPWSLDVRYFAEQPADDPDGKVAIATKLSEPEVEEGGTVSLEVRVRNQGEGGQPMTLAIVGLPAGLEAPTKVLEDLLEAERFDLWEIRGRELILYWRDLAPEETQEVTIDLVARIPGVTTGPASRAYLYYTPEAKRWSEPLRIEVTPVE